jgi:hypothetical protein
MPAASVTTTTLAALSAYPAATRKTSTITAPAGVTTLVAFPAPSVQIAQANPAAVTTTTLAATAALPAPTVQIGGAAAAVTTTTLAALSAFPPPFVAVPQPVHDAGLTDPKVRTGVCSSAATRTGRTAPALTRAGMSAPAGRGGKAQPSVRSGVSHPQTGAPQTVSISVTLGP